MNRGRTLLLSFGLALVVVACGPQTSDSPSQSSSGDSQGGGASGNQSGGAGGNAAGSAVSQSGGASGNQSGGASGNQSGGASGNQSGGASGNQSGGAGGSATGGLSGGAGGSSAGTGGRATGGAGGTATGGARTGTGGRATGGAGAAGTATGGAAGGGGGGVTCTLPNLPAASALTNLGVKLPDPFTFYDGTKVTTKAQWECRRKEILAMAAKYLYGPVPGDCDSVSGTVSGGKISIKCTVGGKTGSFSASISGSGQAIALDLSSGILPSPRKSLTVSGNDSQIKSLYGLSELNPNIANAWMVNRVMDVLEQNPTSGHDPKKLAVSGCSGCGKGAFFVGVFSRIPITVIVESGGGGGTSWRMTEWFTHGAGKSRWNCSDRPQGIDVLENSGICGPWVTAAASSFRSKPETVNNLPFDQHMLLATIAPRYLVHFTNSNFRWCWLAGTSEALASWAAHSVFKALGVPENHSFEVYDGGHCGVGDTGIAAAMFDRALNGNTKAATGKININDKYMQVPVSEWKSLFVDWDMDTVLQ